MKKMLFSLCLVTLLGCTRDLDPAGPMLSDMYGSFRILEPLEKSANQIDFSSGDVMVFTARFTILADWEMTITGRNSGAIKRISGRSRSIDISNGSWVGETTDFPTFQLESCDVQLIFRNYPDTLTTELTITGLREQEAVMLDNFENGVNPAWVPFIQTGAEMKFVPASEPPLAEGLQYYRMGGTVGWDWLKGMLSMRASAYNATSGFGLSNNASSVYFNGIFRQNQGLTNGIILFQFREDDNGDGNFTEGSEDMWSVEIRPESLWKLESLRYSDLVSLLNGQPAPSQGNGVHEPHKLFRVDVLFLAAPNSGYAECDMDLIAFSENKPLQP